MKGIYVLFTNSPMKVYVFANHVLKVNTIETKEIGLITNNKRSLPYGCKIGKVIYK